MQIVEQSGIIEAPAAAVMEAITDIEDIPAWATVPGVIDHVRGQGVGLTYNWRFRVSTLEFKGKAKLIEQTQHSLITKTTGDVDSIWTINLTPVGKNSTIIRVVVEYALSNSFIEPLADVVVQQLAKPEVAQENMRRFKERVENRAKVIEPEETLANH